MAHTNGPIQLKSTMEAIAAALEAGNVVEKAWPWPFEAASPGEAVVGYPTTIEHDQTFGRGSDQATIPVYVIAGVSGEESTLDVIDRLVGDGDGAVKDALESGELGGLDEVISSLRVTRSEVIGVMLGNVRYAAVRHECEVIS